MIDSLISIITPTYKRAGNVEATALFGNRLILACHEFEAAEYKEAHPNNQHLIIPDGRRGNMGKVRNFILDNSPTDSILMVDDDVKAIGTHEAMKRNITLSNDRVVRLIENGFRMADELGTILWGLNQQSDPRFYMDYTPFNFLSPILGPFCGITRRKGMKARYDERLGLNEDYDFSIQAMHQYRKILGFNKYHYVAGHLKEEGGCGAYRTLKREREQAEIMVKKWGDKVVKYNFAKSTNPLVHVPIRGV